MRIGEKKYNEMVWVSKVPFDTHHDERIAPLLRLPAYMDEETHTGLKISVLTVFPEMFHDFLREPVTARAIERGSVQVELIDIKAFAGGSFRHIDDDTYGGGAGMVMRCAPVLDALKTVKTEGSITAVMAPCGLPYTQKKARELASCEHLILICGHYEGLDERIMKRADLILSIGDYVLTGGELPAKVVMDSVMRLLPGVLRHESTEYESFENGLLEYPQFTKPQEYEGERIPEVFLTGDHEKIRRWRLKESLRLTLERRPDLLERRSFTQEEKQLLEELQTEAGN